MKKIFMIVTISFLCCSYSAYGQSFKEVFKEALNAKNMARAEKILKDWDFADTNDPELYVSYFNFYTLKSREKDPRNYDMEYVRKALDFISEGIERFPTRFDMRIGKLYMLAQTKDYAAVTADVIQLIKYSDKIKNNWKSEDFRLLEEPDKMLYGAVQEFQELLFAEEDEKLHEDILQISEEMLRYYPEHLQSRLNQSTIHVIRKEYDKSLETLLKAEKIDSKDPVLLYNIASVYKLKGEKEQAGKYFELTTRHTTAKEADLKAAAQKQLNSLK
jgi:tetratricopeptide (TPR) repeat protein